MNCRKNSAEFSLYRIRVTRISPEPCNLEVPGRERERRRFVCSGETFHHGGERKSGTIMVPLLESIHTTACRTSASRSTPQARTRSICPGWIVVRRPMLLRRWRAATDVPCRRAIVESDSPERTW
jgi:hypothetical protein